MKTSEHDRPLRALLDAIDKAGGTQTALAKKLKIKPQAVQQWVNRAKQVPVRRAIEIEKITGVQRTALRPDIYPDK